MKNKPKWRKLKLSDPKELSKLSMRKMRHNKEVELKKLADKTWLELVQTLDKKGADFAYDVLYFALVAASEDATSGLQARLMVGDAANYYTMDTSGNMTKVYTGSDTTYYNFGRTEIKIIPPLN
jgi:hypothetical protein